MRVSQLEFESQVGCIRVDLKTDGKEQCGSMFTRMVAKHVRTSQLPLPAKFIRIYSEPDSTDDKVDFLRPVLLDVVQGQVRQFEWRIGFITTESFDVTCF